MKLAFGKPSDARIPRPLALQLCALAAITLWPYALYQAWYLSLFAFALIAWRAVRAWQERPAFASWVILPIAAAAAATVVLTYHNPVGRQPGLSLLSLLLPLKLFETRSTRDIRATLLLAFFLIVGMFLHEQTAIVVLAASVATLFAVATAARTQRPSLRLLPSLRLSATLLATGIPLMLVLFVLFPRVNGPLWGLPLDAYGGTTGLSDRMGMQSISQLIPSGEIAFRADFNGATPPPAERYWRGPVLTHFDGKEWRPAYSPVREHAAYQDAGRHWDYTVTLEPNNLRWLLTLDYPTASDTGRFASDFSIVTNEPVRRRIRYTVRSAPDVLVGLDPRSMDTTALLRLPQGFNPRTVAQGRQIQESEADPGRRVEAAISFMRKSGLQYTLSPPPTGRDATDDFLFNTHAGFCEHFAAAFVVLMRAAGVPSRVVTGYQGGERNPVDGTLVVRQSDAHAWAEVWLPQRGWRRVDPTAATFPQRIDQDGLQAALPPSDALPFIVRSNNGWLRALRYRWEALGNAWNQWVLGYNAQRQMALLQKLGLPNPDWQSLGALMAGSAGIWLAWVAWRNRPEPQRLDALDKLWRRFCRNLARKGFPRHDWETSLAYARRMAGLRPAQADTLLGIAEDYARLRFGPHAPTAQDIEQLGERMQLLAKTLNT